MDKEQIKELLKELPVADQKELEAFLAYHRTLRNPKKLQTYTDHENILWECLRVNIPFGNYQALTKFAEIYGKGKYAEKTRMIMEVVTKAFPSEAPTRPQIYGLVSILIECLINYLTLRNIPISGNSLLNSFGLLEYTLDRAYPGYLNSGMLRHVIDCEGTKSGEQQR